MQLVDNISSSSLSFVSLCFMIFHLRLTWWGEHDEGFDIHDAAILYLVKCRNDESKKALINSSPLAEKSQCMSEGMPPPLFLVVHNMGKNCCHCHYDLSCTGKYCDEYECEY